MKFSLESPFKPTGDQPQAIAQIVSGIHAHTHSQTLVGVTGSGKTFTVANKRHLLPLTNDIYCHQPMAFTVTKT